MWSYPIVFDNNVKLKHFLILKVVEDVRLLKSHGNDIKLKHLISKIVKDVRFLNLFGTDIKLEYPPILKFFKAKRLSIEVGNNLNLLSYCKLIFIKEVI